MHYYGQLAAANDCLYRYMYTSQYIAFIDLDELIVPRGNLTTWGQLFDQLEKFMLDTNGQIHKCQYGVLQFDKKSNQDMPYILASGHFDIKLTSMATL